MIARILPQYPGEIYPGNHCTVFGIYYRVNAVSVGRTYRGAPYVHHGTFGAGYKDLEMQMYICHRRIT